MKHHITLPTLQVAATAFLAATCQAQTDHVYCVNTTTSEVVASENCEGDLDGEDFAMVDGPADVPLGVVIEGRASPDDDENALKDLETVVKFGAKMRAMKLVIGGFGRNGDTCDCHARGGYRGGIGAGGVFVGGAGRNRGGGGRGG